MKCYLGLRFRARKNVCSPLQSEVQIGPSLHYSWGCAVGIFQEPMKHKQFGKSPTVFLINRALHYQAWGDHQGGARSSTMDCKRKTPDQGFPVSVHTVTVHTEQGVSAHWAGRLRRQVHSRCWPCWALFHQLFSPSSYLGTDFSLHVSDSCIIQSPDTALTCKPPPFG